MSCRLFWIDLGYATFGIESIDNIVTKTAPIASWMIGKKLIELKQWFIDKKAKVIEIKHES